MDITYNKFETYPYSDEDLEYTPFCLLMDIVEEEFVENHSYGRLYLFDMAPKFLQDISLNGGDEDYIFVCPKEMLGQMDDMIYRMNGDHCPPQSFAFTEFTVYIFSHA